MRKLKDGTVKYKKAALDKAAWMNQPPNPLPIFRKGSPVRVYRGAGWSLANVVDSTSRGCSVRLAQGGTLINVYDARCIKPASAGGDEQSAGNR